MTAGVAETSPEVVKIHLAARCCAVRLVISDLNGWLRVLSMSRPIMDQSKGATFSSDLLFRAVTTVNATTITRAKLSVRDISCLRSHSVKRPSEKFVDGLTAVVLKKSRTCSGEVMMG